jgi:glycosyltransferase involved in cell wall biosynthesis
MWHGQTVTAVLPAYNEEQNIRRAIEDFLGTGLVEEVLVVDNNSSDRTTDEVRQTSAQLVYEEKQGYGHALIRGLKEGTGDLLVLAEPDGTFEARDLHKLLAYSQDFEMVCGTRTTKSLIWDGANMGWMLRFGNLIVAKLLQLLFNGPSLSDCGCTLRLVRRDALSKFVNDLTVGSSHFLPEMVILALINGISIIEVPVNYRSRVGDSKITGSLGGALRTGMNMILLIFAYRLGLKRPGGSRVHPA